MGSFDPGAELGPRLRQVREQRGLSVRELARRTQCSPSLVSQIERGLSAPSVGMLYALATELRTSLDFLFSATAPAGGLTVTAHGDGQLRQAGPAATLPGGHGVIQRAGTRRTIDLALVQMEKQFGKGAILRLGSKAVAPVSVISTIASTNSCALTSVAPHENSISAFTL